MPYWCFKTKKWRPYWCTKPSLGEFMSIFMQKSPIVLVNRYGRWSCEWKCSILLRSPLKDCGFSTVLFCLLLWEAKMKMNLGRLLTRHLQLHFPLYRNLDGLQIYYTITFEWLGRWILVRCGPGLSPAWGTALWPWATDLTLAVFLSTQANLLLG